MTVELPCNEIINHRQYPIDELDNPLRQAAIDRVRAELADDGCAVVRNFFSSAGLEALLAEANARKPKTYYSPKKLCNVYLNDGDPAFAEDHPVNIFIPRSNGFISADNFDETTASHRLYYWPPLKQFLADCLKREELFIYEDPVSNMIVNVGKPGQQFNWHFDTNEFTITMLLEPAESGGIFEYVPGLRNSQNECYEDVRRVLNGERSRVKQLDLNAGDLQFFFGRFSLHQVTENTGGSDRMLLIMSFAETAGMVGSQERSRNLYGKTTEAHSSRQAPTDGLVD